MPSVVRGAIIPSSTLLQLSHQKYLLPALFGALMLAAFPATATARTDTTTTLALTAGSSVVTTVTSGKVVTLTATVYSGAKAITTGRVNFCDATATYCTDIHLLGAAQLTGAGTAVIKLVPGIGTHSYKAVFVGDTSYLNSSSTEAALSVTGKAGTKTTLTQSGVPGDYTLVASVSGSAGKGGLGSLSGSLSFVDTSNDNSVLGTAPLVASSTGWFNSQSPLAGNTPISIAVGDFNGDGIPDLAVADVNAGTVAILLGYGDGTFSAMSTLNVGDNTPEFVAVGDFNGDGIPDLAVAMASDGLGYVVICLGNGDGTFKVLSTTPATGVTPQGVAVGDFNGDGIQDLAVPNYNDNTVTILLGNGDGTFKPVATSPTTGSEPYFVAVGDFNGDGIPDLAVANGGGATLTILLGNGDGTFKAAASPTTGSKPVAITVGDFNRDGKLDLAVANYGSDSVTVLLGNGNGTFTPAASPATGSGPTYVAIGDFNGDGIPDLVVADMYSYPSTLTILQGKGDGTFTTVASPETGANPDSVAVGDFNGDGLADLAAANFTSDTVTVLLAETATATATATGITPVGLGLHQIDADYPGNSSFNSSISATVGLYEATPLTTTTLDITSAGVPVTKVTAGSVVTLTAKVVTGSVPATSGQVNFCDADFTYCNDIHLLGTAQLTGNGTAVLKFVPAVGTHSYKAVFAGVTHVDASSSSSDSTLSVTSATSGKLPTTTTLATTGTVGNYTLTATVSGTGGSTAPAGSVSFMDTTDANQVLGVATLANGADSHDWLSFPASVAATGPTPLAVGDFNGDGIPDLAVTNYNNNNLTILLGNGDGTFTALSTNPSTGSNPYSVAVGDFNGDGIPDLAVANVNSKSLTILLGNGDGTFRTSQTPLTGTNPQSIVVGDFNRDGKLDLAVTIAGNGVTILLGNGDGTFTAAPTPYVPDFGGTIAIGDFNGDGIPDLAVASFFNETVTILLGNGDGTFAVQPSPTGITQPTSIAVGDFNQNGILDLAVTSAYLGNVTILLGNGKGGFTAAYPAPSTGVDPTSVVVGDFNGDGMADLAIANADYNQLTILLGNGDGTFTFSQASPIVAYDFDFIVAANFDGSGRTGLAMANDGSYPLTVLLNKLAGTATASVTGISPLGFGSHLVEAAYAGNATYSGSVSSTNALAGVSKTTLTLSANPTSGTYGQKVVLTAKLTPYAIQNSTTNGEAITFYNGTTSLGSAILSNGVATLNVTALPAGTDSLKAVYAGDSYYLKSTSGTVSCTVSQATPTVTLTASSTSSSYGVSVILTATMNATSATGTVTFKNGTTTLGSGTLMNGVAKYATAILALGSNSITAFYSGDTNFKTAASASVVIKVTKGTQTITFAQPTDPVRYGVTPITLSATASSSLPVTFTLSGPATLTGSTVKIIGVGTVVIHANQAGNTNYDAAPQVTKEIIVDKASLTFKATSTSVALNQAIPTLTYTITGFVNGDTSKVVTGAPVETTTASKGSPAGTYPITITKGTLAAANYGGFVMENGTLTITQ